MKKSLNLLDKSIYLSLFALFLIPLAIPYSYYPLSKFYSEICVLGLALVTATLMLYKSKKVAIGSVGIASIIFALFLLLQIFVVKIRFPGINLAVAGEFIVASIMSIGIVSFIANSEEGRKKLVTIVAFAVLISTTLQAFYGLLQFTGLASNFQNFILYTTSGWDGVFGNVGQKNDYADFIFLGIFALSYLYHIRKVNFYVFVLYELFFFFIATIDTSRTALLYLLVALITAFVYAFLQKNDQENAKSAKKVIKMLALMLVVFIAFQIFLPQIWNRIMPHADATTDNNQNVPTAFTVPKGEITSAVYRFKGRDIVSQTTTRRVYEWYKDLVIFTKHPIFGTGWYQYPKDAIDLMETPRFMYITANTALYTHSHNSPLNVLAETGIIGFLITFGFGFGYTLFRMFKYSRNVETLFLAFMILTTFTQGLFQYPLWYTYFLIYFILFLSFDKPIYTMTNNKTIKIITTLILIAFLYIFQSSLTVYNTLINYSNIPQDSDDYATNVLKMEDLINNNIMWQFPTLMVLDNYLIPGLPQLNAIMPIDQQMKYSDMLANELPYSGAIFKQIIFHQIAGDHAGSLRYANLLAHAFPAWKDKMADQLMKNPGFEEQVMILRNFDYKEDTIFKKIFGGGE